MMKSVLTIVGFLSFSLVAEAQQVIREKAVNHSFKNVDCEKTQTCDLKEFKLHSYDYQVKFRNGDRAYGTRSYIGYETKTVDALEKYIVVQYIRGCQFDSLMDKDGVVKKELGPVRESFGEFIKFKHPKWHIDSIDTDPAYNNGISGMRHGPYRWNTKNGSYEKGTEKYFLHGTPDRPFLYVSDSPGTASTGGLYTKNISLEFRSCLYKTEDVPTKVEGVTSKMNGEPIGCLDWKSSHIYNHKLNKYEKKAEIDPFCLE